MSKSQQIIRFVFASLVLVLSQAQAAEANGAEQPYQESRLHELTQGREVRSETEKTLTFKHHAGSNAPSSLEFAEESERPCQDINCGLTLKRSDFVITKKSSAGCGSVRYEAHDETSPGRVVEVIDHSERLCDDLQPYQWQLILKEPGKATRQLVADPNDIFLIQ